MFDDDIFSFGSDAIEEVVKAQQSERFVEQFDRQMASGAALAWVQNGDPSPEILAEIIEMATGFDDDEDGMDEDDEEDLEEAEEAVTEVFADYGVSADLAERAINGDEDAARKVFLLMEKALEESSESIEEMHFRYVFTRPIREAADGMSKSEWKKSNRIKSRKRAGKMRKKRMTARQRMAVKKMLRKSHTGIARMNRKKTTRKRKAAGYY
jgi:hypothetical protein